LFEIRVEAAELLQGRLYEPAFFRLEAIRIARLVSSWASLNVGERFACRVKCTQPDTRTEVR